MITPLLSPESVQMVFVDPAADLRRTRLRVGWSSLHSVALAVATFWVLLLAPLPGKPWLQPLLASVGAVVVYGVARLAGRLGGPAACRTITFQLMTRRHRVVAGPKGALVVPAGMSEFTYALDLATESYRLGFLHQRGWDEVRRYIWSYLESTAWSRELVGLGYVAVQIDRICYADAERARSWSPRDPDLADKPGPS